MSNDRDPVLEALFDKARPEFNENRFVEKVMARVDRRRRMVFFGRLVIVALIVLLEFLPSSPLQNSVGTMTQVLGSSLVELKADWLIFIFEPVNSIAGVMGMLLLGLHLIYRRIMR